MFIVLREIEDLSYEEIASIVHENINTVRTNIRRAREKLVAPVIGRFFLRCRELGLCLSPDEESYSLASLAALGTTVVMNYLHTGRYIPD